jgi:Na+-driven multidrug efflux pump
MALNVTYFINLILVWIYTTCLAPRKISSFVCSWEVFSSDGLSEYLTVGIPSLSMLCLEWWAYEILTVSASEISISALGA